MQLYRLRVTLSEFPSLHRRKWQRGFIADKAIMSALDRQTQIVRDLIIRAHRLGLQIKRIEQVGDETPDMPFYSKLFLW
jgi:hypothetical protein